MFRRRSAPKPTFVAPRNWRYAALSLERLEDRITPALGAFELDGNAITQTAHDWDQVYNDVVVQPGQNTSGSIPGAALFIHDPVNSTSDNIFTGGQSTDLNDLSQWHVGSGKPQNTADIADVFAAAYQVQVGATTHTVLNFGADRFDNSGSASMGFWFFQNPVGVNPDGTMTGAHTVGDILVLANFSGAAATITAYKWVGGSNSLQLLSADPTNLFVAVNTTTTRSGGWPFKDKGGTLPTNNFAAGEFVEGGIDLTALGLPNNLSTFVAETRSSTQLNATLSDFVLGEFTTFTADLAVTKTVSNATPNVGNNITFLVSVTNNGPNNATGVSVNDLLPAGLTFVSAVPSQGNYSATTGIWSLGNVARGQTATLQITAQVVSPNAQTNTAKVTGNEEDRNTANNQASVTETPQRADVLITKAVSDATPNVGDTITFTLTVKDNGPNAATNVNVNDLLPTGLSFVAANASQGDYFSNTGVWNVGSVANGSQATLTITAKVTSPAALTNTATVTADQFDPNTANNTASVTETPKQADLVIAKTVNDTDPNVGDTVTFVITVSNSGPNTATNVTVHELMEPGLRFVSATPSQGTFNQTTGIWTVGTVSLTGVAP